MFFTSREIPMARGHPGNSNFRVPYVGTRLDADDEQLCNQDSERKVKVASTARGGGRVGSGRRGGRGGEYVKCCYTCGEPGHIARDCPKVGFYPRSNGRRGNQAYGNSDPSKADVVEVHSGDGNFRRKPLYRSIEYSTNPEPAKLCSDELPSNYVDISSLQANIEQKEKELKLCGQENESLKNRLNEATSEISYSRAEKEEMILKMHLLEEDLKKCKNSLSSARDKEMEMTREWCSLKDELEDTKSLLSEKLKEVEEANEAAEAEMEQLKLEAEQWRKAAKAAVAVLGGGEEICSKAPELESLVLYYSSRAAKRMSLGKMRKAIDDCRIASQLDPNFLKVCVTAGNCHLVLGEVDDAMYNYRKCLESSMVCLDRRLTIEASDGLQNAQKVDNYVKQSAELLQQKTFESATNALEVITEALSISCYSEKLLEMKGEALFMLRKYEKVIQMCEQNLAFAEKNFAPVGDGNHMSDGKKSLKCWRWSLMSRSYFHLGRLEIALTIIEKQEQLTSNEAKTEGSSIPFAATVRELLRCKSAGNEAYQAGRYREALEHYSNALLCSIESRPFTAICLYNRATAHQALGEVIDAIADCNLAIALDGSYVKAIFRRANLHEKIRDCEYAALDLQRLIMLLEKQCAEKSQQSITLGKSIGCGAEDLRLARRRLSSIERNMKKGIALDLYVILGLKGSESVSEIKKAYHKAALRHHPDKAGKFLARSECGYGGQVWKDIVTTINKDADRLFKMIGEAYAVLSDSNKRFKYNLEDSMTDDWL